MKTFIYTIVFSLILVVHTPAMDNWHALAQVESGACNIAVGPKDERGQFQITRANWERISTLPFDDASNPKLLKRVASVYMGQKLRQFEKMTGRKPTTIEWYVLWHAPAHVLHPTKSDLEIANRFQNLVLYR